MNIGPILEPSSGARLDPTVFVEGLADTEVLSSDDSIWVALWLSTEAHPEGALYIQRPAVLVDTGKSPSLTWNTSVTVPSPEVGLASNDGEIRVLVASEAASEKLAEVLVRGLGTEALSLDAFDKGSLQSAGSVEVLLYPEAVQMNEAGNSLTRDGKLQEPVNAYQSAVELDPGNPVYHTNLARALARVELFQDAMKEYQEAINLDPEYALAYCELGRVYEREAHMDLARDAWTECDRNSSDPRLIGRAKDALERLSRP